MTKLSDLDPDVRRAIQSGSATVRRTALVHAAAAAPDGKHIWRCYSCKEIFQYYAPAERHASTRCGGSGRIECVIQVREDVPW